jgi:hypothetical protein
MATTPRDADGGAKPTREGRNWTADEDAALREEFARGPGYATRTAERLGRGERACLSRAWKIHLRRAGDGRAEMAR